MHIINIFSQDISRAFDLNESIFQSSKKLQVEMGKCFDPPFCKQMSDVINIYILL